MDKKERENAVLRTLPKAFDRKAYEEKERLQELEWYPSLGDGTQKALYDAWLAVKTELLPYRHDHGPTQRKYFTEGARTMKYRAATKIETLALNLLGSDFKESRNLSESGMRSLVIGTWQRHFPNRAKELGFERKDS